MWFEFRVFWVAFQNAKLNIIWSNLSSPPPNMLQNSKTKSICIADCEHTHGPQQLSCQETWRSTDMAAY